MTKSKAAEFDETIFRRECVKRYFTCSSHDVEIGKWQHSRDKAMIEKLLAFIDKTKDVVEVLEHAVEIGQYTHDGSTEGWANEVLLRYEQAKKEAGL